MSLPGQVERPAAASSSTLPTPRPNRRDRTIGGVLLRVAADAEFTSCARTSRPW